MKNKRNLSIISLVILNIILDQLSKFWIRANVAPYSDINIISDYFIITNVENSGAFLGLGSDFSPVIKSILLLALPVGVLVTVLVYVFKDKSIGSKVTTELLTNPLIMEESEVLKVQAADANELHVIASILEIQPREVTT